MTRFLRIALICLLVCTWGCLPKDKADFGGGPPLFSPLTQRGAFAVDAREAASLALKMSVRQEAAGGWGALDFPLGQSLAYASSRRQGQTAVSLPGLTLSYGQLSESLRHLQALLPRLDSSPGLLAREFTWYRIGPDFGFTAYYEPTLRASRTRSERYYYPLYKKPADLRSGSPYHTRNAIDRKGVLAGRGLEIAWVDSEADAFFLHIQGSGRLLFEDGSVSHVLYAAKNNRAYVPLGRVMRDRGMLEPDKVSMRSIRQCLLDNPEQCAELFDSNPSYIFFREAGQGPVGAMGRPLTPWVSAATDRSVLPHGSMIFTVLPLPGQDGTPQTPFFSLTLPQDTGGAIKGHRIDLFCGAGENAAHTAGYLNAKGAVYILVKRKR